MRKEMDPLEETQSQTLVRDLFAQLTLDPYNPGIEACENVADDPDDFPGPGDRISGWNTRSTLPNYTHTRNYLRVPATLTSTYTGSLISRSNREALLEDYPALFVHQCSTEEEELLLPFDMLIPDPLVDAITGLCDYPIYDEEHYSNLCHNLLMEWWRCTGLCDFTYELDRQLHEDRGVLEEDFKIDHEWLDEQFWRIYRRFDYTYEEEEDSVYIYEDTLDEIAGQVLDQIIADWNAKVTWLNERQEGLFS